MHPLAIIVPAYKARFLADTLESIASQTARSFQLYVFNDASPEPLAAIAGKFASRISLTYHHFDTNVGGQDLVAQWQRCLLRTTEPWIWFVPDDDILEPGTIQNVLDAIASAPPELVLLRLNISTIGASGDVMQHRADNPSRETVRTLTRDNLLGRRAFSLGENIFRRSAHNAVGSYVSFGGAIGSDLTLLVKLAHHGAVKNLTGPRFRFRRHGAAISSGASKYQTIAVNGVGECCVWLHAWNRQSRIAPTWVFRSWTMRWFHACLKHWAPALTPDQRDHLARFAREHWMLPRFIHERLLFARTRRP